MNWSIHINKEAASIRRRDQKFLCREWTEQEFTKDTKSKEFIKLTTNELINDCLKLFKENLESIISKDSNKIKNWLSIKQKIIEFFNQRKVDALNLEKTLKQRIWNSKSLLKLIKKDLMPHNYRAILKQKMAQNIMRQPQMLQSLSSIQQQLSVERPAQIESFENLPDYFGPASRPGYVPPPSLYQQHVYRQELEYHKIQNVVQFPPPQLKAIKCAEGEDKPISPFDSFKFNKDWELPFKEFATVILSFFEFPNYYQRPR